MIMGIPSYFSYIVKSHRSIIKKYDNKIKINNLYLDCNSIIYDSVRLIKDIKDNNKFENKLVLIVCEKIEYYIKTIKPTSKVFIAFDGVAPVAKLNQQKNRRYKSWLEKQIVKECNNRVNNNNNSSDEFSWNTVAITPGTKFMDKLAKGVKSYFKTRFKTSKKYGANEIGANEIGANEIGANEIIVSAANEPGEGEHKIYEYIRNNATYHSNTSTAIYGLDADLIMLTLNHLHISNKMYLFRETPHFIRTIDSSLDPNTNYLMDIPELAKSLSEDLYDRKNITKEEQKRIIYDYILLCFFLGNDFMPHFTALNIRTDGISRLITAYKEILMKHNEYLTDGEKINWKNIRKLVMYLSKNENDYIKKEYIKRRKMKPPRYRPDEDPILFNLMSIPIKNREVEEYINPFEGGWRARYYKELFELTITEERCSDICINLLEGLEWTMNYYTTGCKNWRWEYKYDYAPLLQDLIHYIPYFDTELVERRVKNPVNAYTQLAYVLPKPYLYLLPHKIEQKIISKYPAWYDTNCKIKWAFCKYFWEAHACLPSIDINTLETETKILITY